MRHRVRGRKLGRNASHRKAMFRNMACSLIRSVRVDEEDPQKPAVPGRIVTTLPKAKELRPFVEKLVTLAKKAVVHEERAAEFETDADRNSDAWSEWRRSDKWQKWSAAKAPAIAMRRRAFSMLRDHEALDILFDELADRFEDRPGGYTRVIRLAEVRLGDSGRKALIEFVGQNDRVKSVRRAAPVVEEDDAADDESSVAADDSETAEAETAVSDEPTADVDGDETEKSG